MTTRSVSVRYSASVGSAVAELNRLAKANEQVATSTEKAGISADKLAKAGALVAFGLGVAVARFAEFDAAMSAVKANTGGTTDELNQLRDAAVRAGQDTQFTATEAAQAINEMAKAGVATTDILNGGLRGAMSLAAAGQLSVADSAENMATALAQFNLRGSEASHVADLLAAGANKAQGGVGDLALALKQGGQVAAQTGLSIEETTTALTAFASAGLIGSDAGTALKTMLQRLTPQSDKAATLMEDLNLSAYTAGGSFIGLAAYAGKLRDGMKNLTPEQRNAAMSVIFGSDAVRAATVLYNEGADGIAKWTEEVNQTGFAARQAATLTDNLKGDVERLGGTFDTVLIQTGSGANSALRGMVQTGEKLIEVAGNIPGPILAGAAAFGALALLGPKVGTLARTVTGPLTGGMKTFRDEMALHRALATQVTGGYQRLGDEAQTASGKVSKAAVATSAARATMGGLKGAASGVLSILGGPWGIALTAATIGVTAFATAQANAQAAGQEFSDTLDQQTGRLTEASRAFVGKKLTGDISGEDLRLLQQLGVNLGDVTTKVLEGGPALQDYIQHFRDRAANEGLQVFSALASAIENTNNDVERGRLIWQGYSSAATAGAGSVNAVERGTSTLENTLNGYGDAAQNAADDTGEMSTLMGKLGANSKEANEALKNLKDAVDLLAGGERAQRAANRQTQEAFDKVKEKAKDYTDAVSKHGKKSKEAREADRDWQAAIDDIADSTDAEIKAMIDNNVEAGKLKQKYDEGRAAIVKQLEARGLHGNALQAEADKIIGTKTNFGLLLDEYKKSPAQVATTIKANGTEKAKAQVQAVWDVVNGQPRVINFFLLFSSNVASAVGDIQSTIGKIGASIFAPKKPAPKRKAGGGGIFGPGTETSDSIPALLSNNEHVWTAAEVRGAGGHDEVARLRKLAAAGALPRFAMDGPAHRYVGSVAATALPRYAGGGPVVVSGPGIDYARLGAVIAGAQQPQFTIHGGDRAVVSAVQQLAMWQGRKSRG